MKFEFRPKGFIDVKLIKNILFEPLGQDICIACKSEPDILFLIFNMGGRYLACSSHVESILDFFKPNPQRIVLTKKWEKQLYNFRRKYKSYLALGRL